MRPIPPLLAGAVLTLFSSGGFASPPPPIELVRTALATGQAALLAPLLPAGARVNLDLLTVPPARGLHGGRQAQVLIQDRLDSCSSGGLESFEPAPSSGGDAVEFRAVLSCLRTGAEKKLRLRGTIEAGADHWTLKDLRELD